MTDFSILKFTKVQSRSWKALCVVFNQSVWDGRTWTPRSESEQIKISKTRALRKASGVSPNLAAICRNVRKLADQANLSDNLRKILFPGLVGPQQATGLTHTDIPVPALPPTAPESEPVRWRLWGEVIVVVCRRTSSRFQSIGSIALLPFHKQATGAWFRMWGLEG